MEQDNNKKFEFNSYNFSSSLEVIEKFRRTFAKRTKEIHEGIEKKFAEINKNIENTLKIIDAKAGEFSEAGWPLPEFLSPKELLDIYENSDLDTIDEKMVVAFDEETADFKNMKIEIFNSKELEEWHPLLQECFWCYSNEKYNVLIPALLTVLEGIIAKKWDKIDGKINIHNFVNRELATDKITFETTYLKSIGKFLKHLFKRIDFKNRDHPKLNRNLILHGRSIKVWGKPDALKLFLNIYIIAVIINKKYT